MTYKQISTEVLKDKALNFAVAKALGLKGYHNCHLNGNLMRGYWFSGLSSDPNCWTHIDQLNYTSNWGRVGPIVDREDISIIDKRFLGHPERKWMAYQYGGLMHESQFGPTHMVAAMRCYVFSKLGDFVEIPEELL